jgi:hypothetical protein
MDGELSGLGRTGLSPANANNSHLQAGALPQPSPERVVDHRVTMMNDASIRAMTLLKPYLLLACVAFTIGFVGYWLVGRATVMTPVVPDQTYDAQVSAILADPGDWNPPRDI